MVRDSMPISGSSLGFVSSFTGGKRKCGRWWRMNGIWGWGVEASLSVALTILFSEAEPSIVSPEWLATAEVNTNTSGWPDILESDKDGRHLILRPSELPS
ncbi:hypothetical protein GE21DRAFT_1282314, partial [Neurospora crassa]